jgi:uncharacterized membrane protein YobD (UPF0266 family)
MTMNNTPLDSSFQCANFESKKFYLAFFVSEKFTKNQKPHIFAYFWFPHQQMGSMARTFHMPDFNSSCTITHRNFVRIGDKKIFSKKPRTPTFFQICTLKNHLNGRSSLIKHNMTMNNTPLDSSFQCANFESKKFYLAFFVSEKFTKNQKPHIFAYFWFPHQQMGSMARTFHMPDFNSSCTITHRNFVRIGDKHFF